MLKVINKVFKLKSITMQHAHSPPLVLSLENMADWISEEKESELIKRWQTRRVLYDVTTKGYSNRIQRLTALSEMAEVFGKTPEYFFSLTHPRSEMCGVILIQCVFTVIFLWIFNVASLFHGLRSNTKKCVVLLKYWQTVGGDICIHVYKQ